MTLRVGLIGCGRWGQLILRDLLALGATVDVVAPSEGSRAVALKRGAANAVACIDMLPEPADGFVVASPTVTHAEVIEALLPTGRPVFVEKPLTNAVAAARRIVAAGGERVFVMDKWRYHPGVEALAAMAKSGELGSVLAVRSYRLGLGIAHDDADNVWHLLPHDLSIALEILGRLPPASAAWSLVPGRTGDNLIAILSGGPGTPQVTAEIASSHPVDRRSVLVVGTHRVAQLGGSYDDRIIVADVMPDGRYGAAYDHSTSDEMPLLKELRAFLGHLRGGPPPRSSAAEGLLVVERIAAIRRLAGLD